MSDVQNSLHAGQQAGDSVAAPAESGDIERSIRPLAGQGAAYADDDVEQGRGSLRSRFRSAEPNYRRSLFRR